MGATAGAIAAGDLSRRVSPADDSHRGRTPRPGAERDARPDRAGLRRAPGERGPPAPLPLRRLARAAHAADVDPRLRRAVPHGRGRPTRRTIEKAMARIEEEAQRMGVLVEDLLALARLDEARRDREPERVDLAPLAARRRRRRARRGPRPRRSRSSATGRARASPATASQLRQVLANLLRNALTHTPPGDADRAVRVPGRERDRACRSATTVPGFRRAPPTSCSSASGAAEGGRERGRGGRRARARDRARDRRGPRRLDQRAPGRRRRRRVPGPPAGRAGAPGGRGRDRLSLRAGARPAGHQRVRERRRADGRGDRSRAAGAARDLRRGRRGGRRAAGPQGARAAHLRRRGRAA